MKIPFFLTTGFLGSGKTTFVKRFLDQYAQKYKVMVIQNEFAPSGIDGIELKKNHDSFYLHEIQQGSVFCVCKLTDFKKVLIHAAKEISPDLIILEATGLADPIAIGQLFFDPDLVEYYFLNEIQAIIDAANFLKLEKIMPQISRQIRVADQVIINKSDQAQNNLSEIIEKVKQINPAAEIVSTTHCKVQLPEDPLHENPTPLAVKEKEKNQLIESFTRPPIVSTVIKTHHKISSDYLNLFIEEYKDRLIRMKGFIHLKNGEMINLQYSVNHLECFEIKDYNGITEIVLLGNGFDVKEPVNRFLDYCQKE